MTLEIFVVEGRAITFHIAKKDKTVSFTYFVEVDKTIKIEEQKKVNIGFSLVIIVCIERDDNNIVAINDPFIDHDYMVYMFKYDSTHRRFNGTVEVKEEKLVINGQKTTVFLGTQPSCNQMGISWCGHCFGIYWYFHDRRKGFPTFERGCQTCRHLSPMFVMSVNEAEFKSEMNVIINASCTKNCLGIDEGLMTTVHTYTAKQKTVDGPSGKTGRDGRGAGENVFPASTGAAKAVGGVIPSLNGILAGIAYRVPNLTVSVVDLTCRLTKGASMDKIKKTIKHASETKLKDILGYTG